MMRRYLFLFFIVFIAFSCSKLNVEKIYCEEDSECPKDYECDYVKNLCVLDGSVECFTMDECSGKDVCNEKGQCVECVLDEDCTDASFPYCDSSYTCSSRCEIYEQCAPDENCIDGECVTPCIGRCPSTKECRPNDKVVVESTKFSCQCKDGYITDGDKCYFICATDDECGNHAYCDETCFCEPGYKPNGDMVSCFADPGCEPKQKRCDMEYNTIEICSQEGSWDSSSPCHNSHCEINFWGAEIMVQCAEVSEE